MTTTATRRAILAGAPVAALAAITAAPCAAIVNSSGVSPDMAAAIRAYGDAKAEVEAYRKIHGPIEEAWFAARTLPHVTTKRTYINIHGQEIHSTTESVGMARSILRDADSGAYYQDPRDADFVATMREVVAASDARDAEAARIRAAIGYDAAEERMDELLEADTEALDEAVRFPVTSFADLLAKVELIRSEEAWDFRDTAQHLIADIRRLGGVA